MGPQGRQAFTQIRGTERERGGDTVLMPALPTALLAHRDPGRLQIGTCRFPTDRGGLLDTPQRSPQSPQRQNLLLFVVAQDVAHGGNGTCVPRRRQCLGCYAWWPVFTCPVMVRRALRAPAVSRATRGQVLLHCHCGCELEAILTGAGLTMKDLFPEGGRVYPQAQHCNTPAAHWRRTPAAVTCRALTRRRNRESSRGR